MKALLFTGLALLALLALTVACSVLLSGALRYGANLGIAAVKAALIAWVFMDLRRDSGELRLAALVSAVLLLVLAALLGADVTLRAQP